MIAKLTGTVEILNPAECIIDISGVGYHLHIPFTTYEVLQNGVVATLHVYALHKEDQFKLYGFESAAAKEFFAILLNVSGIGASMGLAILSGISVEEFIDSIESDRFERLMKIPGIGKSKAEKIIFELKRKIKKLKAISSGTKFGNSQRNDAIEALMALGFDEKKSTSAVDSVRKEFAEISIEKTIKEALKILSA
ncbi:MAG: Holliday junction branch migration protein RuvA [Leptospirales bacterium]|nr:Holliday junction branch migration protein RuvA [Leptospirales bacterium]